EGGNLQGGMNEAGLTFDFNAINTVKNFDIKSKKLFSQGDSAILPHILGTMRSVQEVVDFFKEYWFQTGFRSAQLHVADRQGRFAIISASGFKIVEKGKPLISTNFDICGKEDSSSCWRYAKATSKLLTHPANLGTMMAICRETAQNKNTLYSNVQNLTTGDIWFFSQHDPGDTVKINLKKMLSNGRKSYSFSNLSSLTKKQPAYQWVRPIRIPLEDSITSKYVGVYQNQFVGNLKVDVHRDGIKISNGDSILCYPKSHNSFFLEREDYKVEFTLDKKTNQMVMNIYNQGFWSASFLRRP
ncbi:MAG TPA: hypothetical protein VF691_11325, partial [Cytophagaceae bacterium]